MKKLYVIRHFVVAKSIKEAVRISKDKEPEDVFIAEEWFNKVGFLDPSQGKKVTGFTK